MKPEILFRGKRLDNGEWNKEFTAIPEQNPPLILEELQEMDGKPVYCISNYEITVNGEKATGSAPRGGGIVTGADLRDQGFIIGTAYTYYLEHYSKTWRTYRRRPEEVQQQ